MKKLDINILNSWLSAGQSIALIVGVFFAVFQLRMLIQQTKLQTESLRQTQEISSANFVLEIEKRVDGQEYEKLTALIENGDENTPVIQAEYGGRGGPFTNALVYGYLGNLDEVGLFVQKGLVSPEVAYEDFSYTVEKVWCNKDIRQMIKRDRDGDKTSTALSNPFYSYLETLANSYLSRDNIDCKKLK